MFKIIYYISALSFLTRLKIIEGNCDSEPTDVEGNPVNIDDSLEPLSEVLKDIDASTTTLHIQFMNITSLNLQDFSFLSSLRSLHISDSNVREFKGGNLPALRKLDFSNNDIRSLSDRTFNGLDRLEILNLQNNNINSISKNAFSRLRQISAINLRGNPISTADEMFISNRNLVTLNLMDCQLRSFPVSLPDSLQNLCLGYNSISSIQKSALQHLKNLVKLTASFNGMSYMDQIIFSSLERLTELNLDGNQLESIPVIPRSLQHLSVKDNTIQAIDYEVFSSGSPNQQNTRNMQLIELNIAGNKIQKLSDDIFSSLGNLQKLVLDKNPLKSFGENALRNLKELQTLSMCEVSDPLDAVIVFRHVQALQNLVLRGSPTIVKSILNSGVLRLFPKLRRLDLRNAGIRDLSCKQSDDLRLIAEVELSGNPFVCDDKILCFQYRILLDGNAFKSVKNLRCRNPIELRGQLVKDVVLVPSPQTTTPRQMNSITRAMIPVPFTYRNSGAPFQVSLIVMVAMVTCVMVMHF